MTFGKFFTFICIIVFNFNMTRLLFETYNRHVTYIVTDICRNISGLPIKKNICSLGPKKIILKLHMITIQCIFLTFEYIY